MRALASPVCPLRATARRIGSTAYATQADAISASCEREGMELLYVGKERAVSGGADLGNRRELSRALEAVERGEADVIVGADRGADERGGRRGTTVPCLRTADGMTSFRKDMAVTALTGTDLPGLRRYFPAR